MWIIILCVVLLPLWILIIGGWLYMCKKAYHIVSFWLAGYVCKLFP